MVPKIIVEVSVPSRGRGGHVVGFVKSRHEIQIRRNTYYLSQIPANAAHRFLTSSDALEAVGSLTTFAPPFVRLIEMP